MTLPDLTKLTEQELIATMPPLVSVFLRGSIRRPADAPPRLMACGWCEDTHEYHDTTPDGWTWTGRMHCCPACAPNVLPEHTDE